ncbi:MAG: kinase [Novosphingobium sp.]
MPDTAQIVFDHIVRRLPQRSDRPLVVGICGAQGSGKTWLTAAVAQRLERDGLACATLSLDDLYLSKTRRQDLARTIHPLFAVRGVPGTHDVALGIDLLRRLGERGNVRMPVFDKACDDLLAIADWRSVDGPVDVVLFEGWCVGATAQGGTDLVEPVNRLEREEDSDGAWRRHVNNALSGPYQTLFSRMDMLVLLQAPGFEIVAQWRTQQEETLRAHMAKAGTDTSGLMDRAGIERFVMFYERLTRHILAEMPKRADLTISLDSERCPLRVSRR